MGAGSRAPADPRRRGGDPRRPRAPHRPGPLDGRAARRRAARARAGLRGRRQRLHRRPPADASSPSTSGAGVVLVADLGATHSRLARQRSRRRAAGRDGVRHGHRRRPRGGARRGRTSASTELLGEIGRARRATCAAIGIGVPGPVAFSRGEPVAPPIMPGWDGFSIPRWFAEPLRRAGARRQRREHHGARRALDALARHRAPAVRQGRHRHRLRDRRRAARSTAAPRAPRATSATSASPATTTSSAAAATSAASRRSPAAARSPRRLTEAGLEAPTAATSSRSCAPASRTRSGSVREAGRYLGEVLAGCVNFFNPGAIVIGGDIAEAHQQLLAGVREVIFQRSLPLATRRSARSCRAASATARA